jgi:hypothetical protein
MGLIYVMGLLQYICFFKIICFIFLLKYKIKTRIFEKYDCLRKEIFYSGRNSFTTFTKNRFQTKVASRLSCSVHLTGNLREEGSECKKSQVMKKNEILSFASKWIEVENIILSEVSQAQKTKNCMFSLICEL